MFYSFDRILMDLSVQCRSEAPLERALWTQQRHHLPWCTVVETLVLVVVACPAAWDFMA